MSEEGIAVCYIWEDGTIFDNGAETGGNVFVIKVLGVGLEEFSEIAEFDFGINQIIIFY